MGVITSHPITPRSMKSVAQLTLLLLLALNHLQGQEAYTVKTRFLGIEDGLSSRNVNCLIQDRQGFLWIGTEHGLNRFDSYRFKVFNQDNAGLPFESIHHLWEDEEGWFWLFNRNVSGGLFFFHPGTESISTFAQRFPDAGFSDADINGHVTTADHAMWVFFRDRKSIARYHDQTGWTRFPFSQSAIHLLCPADSQRVVCLLDNQLMILDPDGNMVPSPPISGDGNFMTSGTTFIPYKNGLLSRSAGHTFHAFDPRSIVPPPAETPFNPRRADRHYVISPDLYLNSWKLIHRRLGPLTDVTPFLANGIHTILPIDESKVWVGGHNGILLLHVKPVLFTQILDKSFFDNLITRSCRGIWATDQTLYVHMEEHGLFSYDMQTGRHESVVNLDQWGYFGITHRDGKLYGGTSKGIYSYDPGSGEIQTWPFNDWILHLYPLQAGGFLCGSEKKGLLHFDESSGRIIPLPLDDEFAALSGSEINYIGHDADSQIWVCASTGFYAFHPDSGITARYWREGKGEYHFPASYFRHFHVDKAGMFWITSRENGVIIWDPARKEVRKINRADGLTSDNAYAVYENPEGQLWVSTDHGINQIDKSTMHLKMWKMQDGLLYDEFNSLSHFQDRQGRIYFGGLDGVTWFDPDQFKPVTDDDPEPFKFCDLQVFNSPDRTWKDRRKAITEDSVLRLHPGDNLIRIEFALLDLDQPQDIRYSWQLSGFDTTWHQIQFPELQISRPPTGKYQLRIRAIPSQGIWQGSELVVNLKVIPPVIFRPWFSILATLLLLTGIWQFGRWRSFRQKQRAIELEQEVAIQTATIRKQTEELKHLDELKSRFFANISHELRTPLTLLLGPISSLLKKKNLDAADRTLLKTARANGQHLLQMVGEILDLGKLETSSIAVEWKQVDMHALFTRYCQSFSSHAERIGITFTIENHLDDQYLMMLDEKKFMVILRNLLSNAFKFTPAGGTVKASIEASADQLTIRIADTGRGIHADDLPHVFERYYQSRQQHAPAEGGTGIGLALCKEYVSLLGGTIRAISPWQHNSGSLFEVTLPVTHVMAGVKTDILQDKEADESVAQTDPSFEPAIAVNPNQGNQRILVVEDHASLRSYLHSVLTPGYTLHMTNHGQEAWAYLELLSPDKFPALILSDIMMPMMDGFQLAEKLKTSDRYRHIPLIMLTARADMQDKLRALRIGVDDYLLKPFEEDELLVRIHNLIRNAQHRSLSDPDIPDAELDDKDEITFLSADQEWLEQLELQVEKLMTNFNLDADMVADAMAMSRTTLFRRIKKLTGLTVQQYVAEVRFRTAREWLERGKHSTVKSVALSVGLKDVEHFSKQFRERFGKLPSSYLN